MMTDSLSQTVIKTLKDKGKTLATAESCTGGGIGHALTAVSGSSVVYLGGIISYANSVKEHVLHVSSETLKLHGAVSAQTARAMAEGVRNLLRADVAVSVTGIAGPASDDTKKPVGLVYIAVSTELGIFVCENHFSGDREEVRSSSIQSALKMILEHI